ncbi:unnamed protein product, partial [Meganyctiphanes norvegica]
MGHLRDRNTITRALKGTLLVCDQSHFRTPRNGVPRKTCGMVDRGPFYPTVWGPKTHRTELPCDGAKITDWSHFESEYTLGHKIVFQCSAEGNPRPRITWYKNGIEVYAHNFFQIHRWEIGEKGMKEKMEIDPASQMDAGYYECQADNHYAVDVKGFSTDYSLEFE